MCTASRGAVRRGAQRGLYVGLLVVVSLTLLPRDAGAQDTAGPSGLGRPPTDAEKLDILVAPDGANLPEGSGTASDGAMVFERRGCPTCHGPTGTEGPSISLVGGQVTTFSNYWPIVHWPFAPSIWDYIRRVMPYDRPGILTVDEVYAVTAFLLHQNGIIEEDEVMTAESLPLVEMPHVDDYVRPDTWTPEKPRGFQIPPAP